MSKKKLSIDKSVIELERKQKEHIGANGISSDGLPVHLPVDSDNDGFMPVKTFNEHQQLFNKRKMLSGTNDVLKLEPGYYEGSHLINHPACHPTPETPTTWISNVDVIDGSDGRREITIMDNYSALFWKRTIHTGGNPDTGSGDWIQYHGYVTLWSGDSVLDKPVTLAHSILDNGSSKYQEIIAEYVTDTGNAGKQSGSRYGIILDAVNLNDDPEVISPNLFETKIEFPTDKTAKAVRNKSVNFYLSKGSNAAMLQKTDSHTRITKIVGVL